MLDQLSRRPTYGQRRSDGKFSRLRKIESAAVVLLLVSTRPMRVRKSGKTSLSNQELPRSQPIVRQL